MSGYNMFTHCKQIRRSTGYFQKKRIYKDQFIGYDTKTQNKKINKDIKRILLSDLGVMPYIVVYLESMVSLCDTKPVLIDINKKAMPCMIRGENLGYHNMDGDL